MEERTSVQIRTLTAEELMTLQAAFGVYSGKFGRRDLDTI
jgi:hypothetical protein